MTDLGDISQQIRLQGISAAMSTRLDLAIAFPFSSLPDPDPDEWAQGPRRLVKAPLSVIIPIPYGGLITLLQNGNFVETTRGAEDVTYFYDYDDGVYYAYQYGGTGAWRVTIAGPLVTVEQLVPGTELPEDPDIPPEPLPLGGTRSWSFIS